MAETADELKTGVHIIQPESAEESRALQEFLFSHKIFWVGGHPAVVQNEQESVDEKLLVYGGELYYGPTADNRRVGRHWTAKEVMGLENPPRLSDVMAELATLRAEFNTLSGDVAALNAKLDRLLAVIDPPKPEPLKRRTPAGGMTQ